MAALAIWTFRATGKGHPARKAALWSLFFLVTEALLGAALVLRGWVEQNASTDRVVAQAIHFTNTLLLMAALTLNAFYLTPRQTERRPGGSKLVAWTAVLATIVMGATGALAALADTLFPSPSLAAGMAEDFARYAPMLVRMRWLHPAAVLVGSVCVVWIVLQRVKSYLAWDRLAVAVVGLLALQFALGIADVLLLAPTWMQLVHLAGADLYWVALVVLVAETIWPEAVHSHAPARAEVQHASEATI